MSCLKPSEATKIGTWINLPKIKKKSYAEQKKLEETRKNKEIFALPETMKMKKLRLALL